MSIPDFVVVGAAKAGTTSIHQYLRQHPRVRLTEPKETFFFTLEETARCQGVGAEYNGGNVIRTWQAYQGLFASSPSDALTGEICVAYLYFPSAAARIHAANPNCQIFIVLRHPVHRAYANYTHHVRDGLEPLSFGDALAASAERMSQGYWWGFDYVGASTYSEQVERYRSIFGAERVEVLFFEDMLERETRFVNQMLRTLGLAELDGIDATPMRPGRNGMNLRAYRAQRLGLTWLARRLDPDYWRGSDKLDPRLGRELFDVYFRADVERLSALLGKRIELWTSERSNVSSAT
ncbi:MAG TPA: sulfotransferase [Pirellulales bacterium]|nr:sulfotransferase [Pirellulales bacterium]